MNRALIAIAAIIVVGVAAFIAITWRPAIAPVAPAASASFTADQIERGRVLAAAGNCASCHGENHAGGRPIASDFGTIYVSNITPDPKAGIGAWSEAAFKRALRTGVARDGSHLLPAFPYTHFAGITDQDIADLYAYIMTRPAVATAAPVTKLKGIYNWRALQGGWKLLYFHGGAFKPDQAKSAEWNRGAYLAETVAHCGACHSPRNTFGAELGGAKTYSGALIEDWYAPSINAKPDSKLPWTVNELYSFLRTGATKLHGVASGSMSDVVHGSLSKLPDADVHAIAVYFADKTQAVAEVPAADVKAAITRGKAELDDNQRRGQLIYNSYCISCHFNRPDAPSATRPELTINSAVVGPDPTTFLRVLLTGVTEADGNPDVYMPGFAKVLSDRDIVDVASYLRASYATSDAPAWSHVKTRAAELRALNDPIR
jgi:mono/diheme cytochrome c family protein